MCRSTALLSLALLSAGCGTILGIDVDSFYGEPDAADGQPDAAAGDIDADVDRPDASTIDAAVVVDAGMCESWQAVHFESCAIPPAVPKITIDQAGNWTFNTDDGALTGPGFDAQYLLHDLSQDGGPNVALLSVNGFSTDSDVRLRVVGQRPLLIASWSDIVISGFVDVSSKRVSTVDDGAGANPKQCALNAPGNGGVDVLDGGGGGGAGFGGDGGKGGIGGEAGDNGGNGSVASLPSWRIRGGCRGGRGGRSTVEGGPGGGAIQLTARERISIDGTVNASGGGGSGVQVAHAGGGGGGSGGFIGLDAPSVVLLAGAVLAANGGGGGAGYGYGKRAYHGADGTPTANAASGGTEDNAGGAGGHIIEPDGQPGAPGQGRGGGGGGGGVGMIVSTNNVAATPSTTVSPALIGL